MLQVSPAPLPTRVLAAAQAAWIPPFALLAGQLAHGASWVLLGALAWQGWVGLPGLAWVHLVALGWLSTVSLAVLVHVIPGVLDVEWRGAKIARGALAPFWLGSLALALGFWLANFTLVTGAAVVVVGALVVYLAIAARTLYTFAPAPDNPVAVLRGFITVLIALALTAALGVTMALALQGSLSARWLVALPALHAHLGAIGWLTLLVVGVATRTVRRITGTTTSGHALHIGASTLLLAALVALGLGLFSPGQPWLLLAALLGLLGAGCQAMALAKAIFHASVLHRPPQAFIGVAGLYLVAAAGLGIGVAMGWTAWQPAYVFVALAGWLGQMVNGHMHHIGVRLIATMARGDDDETPSEALLAPSLSWAAFGTSQAAVLLGALALMGANTTWLGVAAICGFLGWACMVANLGHAWRVAKL